MLIIAEFLCGGDFVGGKMVWWRDELLVRWFGGMMVWWRDGLVAGWFGGEMVWW